VYDPKTRAFTPVDTCGNGAHLHFAEDENHTLWTGSQWFSVKIWDETGDSSKAPGWFNYVLDTNGNGRRDEYVASTTRSIGGRHLEELHVVGCHVNLDDVGAEEVGDVRVPLRVDGDLIAGVRSIASTAFVGSGSGALAQDPPMTTLVVFRLPM
jgi:hypothetical protein